MIPTSPLDEWLMTQYPQSGVPSPEHYRYVVEQLAALRALQRGTEP